MPVIARNEAAPPLALALDMGTSSVRALIVDAAGRTLAGSIVQNVYQPSTTLDGGSEADAELLLDLVVDCIDRALHWLGDDPPPICAVGMTSFWHGLLGLGDDAAPSTPLYYWADTRSAPDAAILKTGGGEAEILHRTGARFHSNYWPAKLHWLARERPDQFARTRCWTTLADYLLSRFGALDWPVTSVSMASGTGMLDVHNLVWDQPLFEQLALDPDTMCTLAPDNHGYLLAAEWAARWPRLAGIPWFPAFGDGACANVGSGAFGRDRIALTLGTSGAMRMIVPAPAGLEWSAPPALWAYRLDRQRAVIGGALSNGGNLMYWLRELFGETPEGAAMAAAASVEPDSHGLSFLPFVAGERSPGWHDQAGGVIAGLVLATTRADILRAAMEASAYRFARIYHDLEPLAAPDHLIVANGGAILQSPLWLQIVADTLGHALSALPEDDEASARGAAMMALVGAGVAPSLEALPDPADHARTIEPEPARFAAYQRGLDRQTRLESLLFADGGWDRAASDRT